MREIQAGGHGRQVGLGLQRGSQIEPGDGEAHKPGEEAVRRKWRQLRIGVLEIVSGEAIANGFFLLLANFSRVKSDMLLQNDGVGELLVANGTLMQDAKRRFRFMNSHMRLQISLCCKSPPTEFTSKRPFAGMRAIMHL